MLEKLKPMCTVNTPTIKKNWFIGLLAINFNVIKKNNGKEIKLTRKKKEKKGSMVNDFVSVRRKDI